MKKIFNNNLGISILEVIVAIFVIIIGMVGVLSLMIQNIQAQYIDKNVLVASGLAQEGLEIVRNIRDGNWLIPGNAWNQDIVGDGTYAVDYKGRSFINQAVDTIDDAGARLYINANNLYTHTASAMSTNFYRLITVDAAHAEYLDVKCKIRWNDGGKIHDYTAETYLYNWR